MELFARRAMTEVMLDAQVEGSSSRNDAGVRVNHDTALSDDAILASVSLLAGDIAALPMRALVTTADGLTQPLPRQPAWLDAPDPLDLAITDVAHRMQVALSLLLAGNAYTLCEPSVLDPVTLTVLDPTRVRVIKPGRERLFEIMGRSSLVSPWEPRDVLDTMSSAQVLHTPYMLRPGRLEGLSPIDAQSGNLAISIAMRKWVETFFGKGAQVAGLVSLPMGAQQTDVDDVQERIQKKWSSWRRAGVAGVLSGGATWIKTGLSPQDADLGVLWRRQLEMAARIYGIPPFMIGSQEPAGVAYASSVERAQHYIDHCLARYTRPIEKSYSRLVPGDGRLSVPGSDTGVRFVFDAFLRGDPKARWETYLSGLNAKARTIGEVRALENLRPLSEYSDEYLAGPDGLFQSPNNNASGEAPPPAEPEQEPTQRSEPVSVTVNSAPVTVHTPPVHVTTSPVTFATPDAGDAVRATDLMVADNRESLQLMEVAVVEAQQATRDYVETRLTEVQEAQRAAEAQRQADIARITAIATVTREVAQRDELGRPLLVIERRGDSVIQKMVERDDAGRILRVTEVAA
jgi:HK97 family phage portal protein